MFFGLGCFVFSILFLTEKQVIFRDDPGEDVPDYLVVRIDHILTSQLIADIHYLQYNAMILLSQQSPVVFFKQVRNDGFGFG